MEREATHWTIVPVSTESMNAGDPRLPGNYMTKALQVLQKLGNVKEIWFHRNHDGPMILDNGQLWSGPGFIYYAIVEVDDDVRETPSGTGEAPA